MVPSAYVAAGCPRRGADGGLSRTGRRAAQDGDLRLRALRAAALPGGYHGLGPGDARARARRDRLRGARRDGAGRHQEAVAYSSVAHLGFVMLGIFALNVQGLDGAVLQMVNHGLSTGALFILVGMIYERRHTRKIADFGGIAKPMPVFAACFGIVTMSSIGLPLLNGFVGEFLILLGVFLVHPWVATLATSGVVLAAVYMLWMYRRVMFGPVEVAENRSLIDLGLREKLVMVALIIPIVWIGVYPNPFFRRIEPSVIELLRVVDLRRTPPVGMPPMDESAGGARGSSRTSRAGRRCSRDRRPRAPFLRARADRLRRHGRHARAARRSAALAAPNRPWPSRQRDLDRKPPRAGRDRLLAAGLLRRVGRLPLGPEASSSIPGTPPSSSTASRR